MCTGACARSTSAQSKSVAAAFTNPIVTAGAYNTMKAVSVPPIPSPLDQLGRRSFSFYPAIVNIEHNEWVVRRTSWSDVQEAWELLRQAAE